MKFEMVRSGKEYDAIKKSGVVGDSFYCCGVFTRSKVWYVAVPYSGTYSMQTDYTKSAMWVVADDLPHLEQHPDRINDHIYLSRVLDYDNSHWVNAITVIRKHVASLRSEIKKQMRG